MSCVIWCLVVLCFSSIFAQDEGDWRFVKTAQGHVRGRKEPDGVYVFYNLPYATAPSGDDKFKAPLPPPKWTETYEAADKGIICPQADFGAEKIKTKTMQEDCLIANVYVPDTLEKNLPVVLYIHGGAFQVGFGDWLKPKQLMKTNKIIVVTFNYRVGIHGFLCLGTKDVPGNAGMKDIVAMLRWLKKNIASFGGNPDDVTVAGYSAGAAAADLLTYSKSANGLYKRLIIESGSSLAEYAVQLDPLENAKSHAKTLNFTKVDDIRALEWFYKTLSDDALRADAFLVRKDSTFVFVPCVERDTGDEVFLDDSPTNILKKGDYNKVPMLYGFTDMEGLMRAHYFDLWKSGMNDKFSDFLPADLKFDSDKQKEKVADRIKKFYFEDKPVDTDSILGYVDYFTDIMFASPALRTVSSKVASGSDQIYLYLYSFVDENDPFVPHTKVKGASHAAQSHAIFDDLIEKNSTIEFENLREIMREMWRYFITTGKPVPKGSSLPFAWRPTNAARSPHMSLGRVVELDGILLEDRGRFWDGIYKKHHREPVPPSTPS
ncbi:para-nitrobenzyl esterase-like [Anticarsia gemmatalis]|uniref:para-nitrobenzyl esterase-like n=1 Tax=Anticarsia gemmatalis TaxID=129554 RepID=UPI003F760D3D